MTSLAWGISMVVCPMICGTCLRSEERATGMQVCDTVSAVPRLLAPIIASFIITLYGGLNLKGIRPLYWLEVAGLMIAFFIIFKFFIDPSPRDRRARLSFHLDMKIIFTEGVMVKRWLIYLMVSTLPIFLAPYIPLYAEQFKGADQFILGLMDSAYWASIIILALPTGLWADRLGRKRLVMLMTPLYSLSLFILIFANNQLALILTGFLNGFIMLSLVTQGAITAELVPIQLLGSWYGIIGLMRGLVNATSPLLGGFIWESIGPTNLLIFLSISQLVKIPILASMPSSITRD
jgi:MFS family permease